MAAILEIVDVPVFASALCAEMVSKGIAFKPSSKLFAFLLKVLTLFGLIRLPFLFIQTVKSPIKIVREGNFVPNESGLQIIDAPGHCVEQIAIFYPVKEALLFAADTLENKISLKPCFAYQSKKINQQTLRGLASFPFTIAVFGHGKAVSRKIFNKMAIL